MPRVFHSVRRAVVSYQRLRLYVEPLIVNTIQLLYLLLTVEKVKIDNNYK